MTLEQPSIRRLYKILLGLLLKKGNRIRALKILMKFSRRLHLKDKKTLQKVLYKCIKK